MSFAALTLAAAVLPLSAAPADGTRLVVQPPRAQEGPAAPAPIAGEDEVAVLRFELVDEAGEAIPGRLTFTPEGGGIPDLFPNVAALPHELAVRRNVVYSLSGRGAITVPAGRYTVTASRGLEWSLASQQLELAAGAEASFRGELRREVDTRGWISGDFHLHTLTHSGHGDANLEERIISLVGEGVELAVATDHNHHTDYGPTVEQLGAGARLTTVAGNEVSVPAGHFNAFPLDPARPVPDPEARDANALFQLIRDEPNAFGITPVIQLNHPRWREIDYFTLNGLDPVTGTSAQATYSSDFDTIEVLNANAGWGYHDADLEHDFSTESGVHSALQDWFNLLNRGHRYFAVGNSDSHTVHHEFAGYPRNYVPSSTDDPGSIAVPELVAALRAGRSFTTTGPFVELTVHGQPTGSTVRALGGNAFVRVRVQSASWVQLSRVKLIVNGGEMQSHPLVRARGADGVERWNEVQAAIPLERDSWVCVLVEGDTPLDPVVSGAARPVLPLAVTNPVWIDADANGLWTSPWDQALSVLLAFDDLRMVKLRGTRRIPQPLEAIYTLAAAVHERPYASYMAREALGKFPRELRMAGARAAEIVGDPKLLPSLSKTYRTADDAYQCIALLRAMKACGATDVGERLMALVERFGEEQVDRYAHELGELLPGEPVVAWQVLGPFQGDRGASPLARPLAPETAPEGSYTGKGGAQLRWSDATVREDGYVDLRALAVEPAQADDAVCYARTWLEAPESMEVACALGTDDGGRVWVNGELVHDDPARQSARPMGAVKTLTLRAGRNAVLVKVENATGGFGFYFRVLDERVRASASPE